jgi:hypothetical protein
VKWFSVSKAFGLRGGNFFILGEMGQQQSEEAEYQVI